MGARPGLDGLSGVHTHMSNTRNTPVEAIEHYLPVRMRQYAICARAAAARGSGAAATASSASTKCSPRPTVTVLSDRRVGAPYGAEGGAPGAAGPQHADPRRRRDGAARQGAAHAARRRSAAHRNAGRRRLREAPMSGSAAERGRVAAPPASSAGGATARPKAGARSSPPALGWMLDAFDVMLYALVLTDADAPTSAVDARRAGCSDRSTLLASAAGGIVFGVIADRFGRTRALMLQHPALLGVHVAVRARADRRGSSRVFRICLGLGMGGEWASGAALVVRNLAARASRQGARPHAERLGDRLRRRGARHRPRAAALGLARGVLRRRAAGAASRCGSAAASRNRRSGASVAPADAGPRGLGLGEVFAGGPCCGSRSSSR